MEVQRTLQCVAVCCSVLQCVAVCCSVQRCVTVCDSSNDDSEHDSYGSEIVPCNVFILFHFFMSNISKNKLDCDWVLWARVTSHVFNILTCTNIAFDACFRF